MKPEQRRCNRPGNAHLCSDWGSISTGYRNWLHQEKLGIFVHFQNNLIQTSKDEEVSCTDTSPSLKVRPNGIAAYQVTTKPDIVGLADNITQYRVQRSGEK